MFNLCTIYCTFKFLQVFDAYSAATYYEVPIRQRQAQFEEQYFKCHCLACKENWGLTESLPYLQVFIMN